MLRGMPRLFVPRPEIEPVPPAVETPSLHHWAVREVPEAGTFRQGLTGDPNVDSTGLPLLLKTKGPPNPIPHFVDQLIGC